MSELPSDGPENSLEFLDKTESLGNPVREVSTGFINRIKERLHRSSFELPTTILATTSSWAVLTKLFEGRIAEAVIYGALGLGITGAFAVWAGREGHRLNEQSARLKEQLARGVEEEAPQDGNKPEA